MIVDPGLEKEICKAIKQCDDGIYKQYSLFSHKYMGYINDCKKPL